MDKFYIDREFGVAIHIDVENGIVKRISNESPQFIARMNELYLGKTISQLKKDFEKRMNITYHHVHCIAIVEIQQFLNNKKVEYDLYSNLSMSLDTSDEDKKRFKIKLNKISGEISNAKIKLKKEKERIKKEHNFKVK